MAGQEQEQKRGLGNRERLETDPWVVDISNYEGRSGRLRGIQETNTIIQELGISGASTPQPFYVATHQAFEEYQRRGLTPALQEKLLEAFDQIKKANPQRGAFVGWRTETPNGVPPGPRTGPIYKPNQFLAYIEESWQYAIDNRYNQPGNEVLLAFHPFIHPAEPPMIQEPFLQWPGGDAAPLAEGELEIRAGFGPDELVQSCNHDTFQVRPGRRETRIRKKVAKKETTIQASEAGYFQVPVPDDYQGMSALRDYQIMTIAEILSGLEHEYGPRRLEFIIQPEGIVVREEAPYDPEPSHLYFLEKPLIAAVTVIRSEQDIARIKPPQSIIFLPPELFRERQVPQISLLIIDHCQREQIEKVAVLAWGGILTSHMADNFRNNKVTTVFIGDRLLKQGQPVRVYQEEDGRPAWEAIGEKGPTIVDLSSPEAKKREIVGEKAANLAFLKEKGLPVPPGFCLSTTSFEEYLQSLGLNDDLAHLDRLEGEDLKQKIATIQTKILATPFSPSLREEIRRQLDEFPGRTFSVRSSSTHEERAAGQHATFLNVSSEQVATAARDCLASLFTLASIQYTKHQGVPPSERKMSVLIHLMTPGRGGIIQSNASRIIITAAETPEIVTAGAVPQAHEITFQRETKKLEEQVPPEGAIVNKEEIRALVDLIGQVETVLDNHPRDVEWVIDEEGKPWILQGPSV